MFLNTKQNLANLNHLSILWKAVNSQNSRSCHFQLNFRPERRLLSSKWTVWKHSRQTIFTSSTVTWINKMFHNKRIILSFYILFDLLIYFYHSWEQFRGNNVVIHSTKIHNPFLKKDHWMSTWYFVQSFYFDINNSYMLGLLRFFNYLMIPFIIFSENRYLIFL